MSSVHSAWWLAVVRYSTFGAVIIILTQKKKHVHAASDLRAAAGEEGRKKSVEQPSVNANSIYKWLDDYKYCGVLTPYSNSSENLVAKCSNLG